MNPEDLIVPALRRMPAPWPTHPPEGLDVAVLAAAADHGVAALLATMPATERWPDAIRATLGRTRRAEAAAEVIRRQDLVSLLSHLHDAGIPALLMKGASIAYTHYPSPWLRPRFDTDLLVAPADRARADEVLRGLGYQPATHFDGDFVTHQFRYDRPSKFEFNDVVDLHWKIANPHVFADAFSFDELAADAVAVPALGPETRTLSTAHAFLIACVHRVAHHGNSERLIWLYDIHLLAAAMDAAFGDRVVDLAHAKQLRAVCARGIAQAQSRFAIEPPAGWIARLQSGVEGSEPTAAFLRADRKKIDVLLSDLRTLGGWRQRLTLLREHLFPPAAYMRNAYGVTNPLLLPFSYVIRALTGFRKWFRANGR